MVESRDTWLMLIVAERLKAIGKRCVRFTLELLVLLTLPGIEPAKARWLFLLVEVHTGR